MGSLAALFQQGGFVSKNAGSFAAGAGVLKGAGQLTGGILAQKQAKKNAKQLKLQGKQAETQGRKEAKKMKGAQRARFASGGVQPDEGSALDVQLESEEEIMLAARRRRLAFERDADIQEKAGTAALIQGLFGSGSTLLGAVRKFGQTGSPISPSGGGAAKAKT